MIVSFVAHEEPNQIRKWTLDLFVGYQSFERLKVLLSQYLSKSNHHCIIGILTLWFYYSDCY